MEVKPGIPAVSVDEELLKELAGEVGEGDTVTVKLTVSSSSSSGSSQPILPFVDVKRTDEWYQAIKYVYEKKLMEGASVTTFDPEGELTRAMLAILPMLSEYWFDDTNKLQRWENILQGVFQ